MWRQIALLVVAVALSRVCAEKFDKERILRVAKILEEHTSGKVYPRGTIYFEKRRIVHNGLCDDRRPDIVVVPHTTLDVAKTVKIARDNYMEISVRSGGHSFLCNNIKRGGIHIDMRSLNIVQKVSPNEAILGPGSTWERVLKKLPPKHYTMVHGSCLSVGVGGYLVGGGVNVVGTTERYGAGASNVKQFTVVTPNGDVAKVRRTNATLWRYSTGGEEFIPDAHKLYLAMGNAGSSFGIVTEFLYTIYPHPEPVPVLAFVFIDSPHDIRKLERASQDGRYHLSFFIPYLFHDSFAPNAVVKRSSH